MNWGRMTIELLADFSQWAEEVGYPKTCVILLQFLEVKGYLKDRKIAALYQAEGRDNLVMDGRCLALIEGCPTPDMIIKPKKMKKYFQQKMLENAKAELVRFNRYKPLPTAKEAGDKETFWDSLSEADLMEPTRHFKD